MSIGNQNEASQRVAHSSYFLVFMFVSILLFVMMGCGGNSAGSGSGGGTGGTGGTGGGSGGSGGGSSGSGGSPPPTYASNRTDFVRTDDVPNSAVYDPAHKLVFASEPDLGIVDVI